MSAAITRLGEWIQTRSGRAFYPLDVRPEDICIEDISGALSKICRYGGQCSLFYSVAEHSIHVSRIVPPQLAKAALLHDAAEAYVGDVVRPLKLMLPAYRDMEKAIQAAIYRRFDLVMGFAHWHDSPAGVMEDVIHRCDDQMLHTEMREMMVEPPQPWVTLPPHIDRWKFHYYGPNEAEEAFMLRWEEVTT